MMNLPFRAAPYFGTVAKCGHGGYRTKAEGAERERERKQDEKVINLFRIFFRTISGENQKTL